VIAHGPYRYVRHPSDTGGIVAFLGIALLSGYPMALVLLTASGLHLYLRRIRREESILVANLPGYPEYCRRTP
jgi:protein-S-isoprenylcysteine O-methyltransferase